MSDRNTATQDNTPSNLSPLEFTGVDRPVPVRPSLFRNNGGNVRSIRSANIYESAARSFHYPSNTIRGWRDATGGERPQANGSAFNPFQPIGIPSLTSVSAGPIGPPGMTSVPSQPITPPGLVSASAEQGAQPIETPVQALASVPPIEPNHASSRTGDVDTDQSLGIAESAGSSKQTSPRIEPIGPPGQTSARIQPIGPPGLTSGSSRTALRAKRLGSSAHSKKRAGDPSELVKFAVANSHLHRVAAQSSEVDRVIAETAMLVKAVVGNSKQGKNAPRACVASRREPQRTQEDGGEHQYSESNRRQYQASSTYVDELTAMFEAITMNPNRENSSIAHENRSNISICPHYGCDCYENRFNRCLKVHFDPIFNNNTDISLGDCSYLSTCFKGKNCKYVHYKVSLPQHLTLLEQHMTVNLPHAPETNGGYLHHPLSLYGLRHVLSLMPDPQWINMDIRDLNFRALGNFHVVIADRKSRLCPIAYRRN